MEQNELLAIAAAGAAAMLTLSSCGGFGFRRRHANGGADRQGAAPVVPCRDPASRRIRRVTTAGGNFCSDQTSYEGVAVQGRPGKAELAATAGHRLHRLGPTTRSSRQAP